MPERRLDAPALLAWADAAVTGLIAHADEINGLNVFPIPDADTGTNMLFTMRAALAEAAASPPSDVAGTAAALSRGAEHGARGNSGVVLTQILRALAEVTAAAAAQMESDTALADISPAVLGAALRHAEALVIASMGGRPIEGTVISVLRAAADTVERAADDGTSLSAALPTAGDAAAAALERTTGQLVVLTDAGVVDAGGRGLLVLLDALTHTVAGNAPQRRVYPPASGSTHPAGQHPAGQPALVADAGPEFEVMYLLDGADADAVTALRTGLHEIGDSVAVAPASGARHSIHVHTDDAGAAIERGMQHGTVSRIRISALASGRVSPGGWSRDRAVLAVADGDGAADLFGAEGAAVLRPDADLLDPIDSVSAADLLRGLVDTGAAQVMVLPNGYVAAEDLVAGCAAAISWGIDVVPLPAGSMVQGLAALAVHDPERAAVDDGYAMARAAAGARHGSVRIADSEALTWAGPCHPGDGLGIAGDEVLVVAPDVCAAATGLIDLLLSSGGELVTVLLGARADAGIPDMLAEHVHRRHPGTELTSYQTGHRGDALLIGVE